MNNFHWTNIISLNSSQNDAFEELLCQLAKKENIKNIVNESLDQGAYDSSDKAAFDLDSMKGK